MRVLACSTASRRAAQRWVETSDNPTPGRRYPKVRKHFLATTPCPSPAIHTESKPRSLLRRTVRRKVLSASFSFTQKSLFPMSTLTGIEIAVVGDLLIQVSDEHIARPQRTTEIVRHNVLVAAPDDRNTIFGNPPAACFQDERDSTGAPRAPRTGHRIRERKVTRHTSSLERRARAAFDAARRRSTDE